MDVLFGSIDVRELLSTQDFEESSPLSAPDLRLLIDRLQIRSLQIKDEVRDYIISHHSDFSDIFSRCSDAVSRTDDISGDVSELLRLVSDRPIDIEIRETVGEISSKRRELKEKKEMLVLVQVIVSLVGRLGLVREDLKAGRLVDAAEAVNDLRKPLMIREDQVVVDDKEPLVYGLLRKEWFDRFDEVQEELARMINNAVRVEAGNGRVSVNYRWRESDCAEIELRTVLTAMEVAGVLEYGLAKVADSVVKYVLVPSISNGSRFDFVEELDPESVELAEGVLVDAPSSNLKAEVVDFYSGIVQVIKFVYKFICFQNGRWMQCFGRLTWPRIAELIISNFLSKAVPHDASKLAEFQKIVNHTVEFETILKEMMFVSADEKEKRLSNYAENVEVHFASRKKSEILAKARNLVLKCDFAIPPEYTTQGSSFKMHGVAQNVSEQTVDLLFLPERCIISKAALQLIELVHQILQDICLSSARVAIEFYHAARDALYLYEALVPVKLEKQLNNVNQVAILVHNDCLFLSKEILGLAFEYCPDFPSWMKEQAVFVDMALRFHQMAEEILQKQIQLVRLNLKEAINGADGFQNTHQMQQYESAKFSIDQVVFILEKVHIIWEPLLLPSTYKKSMCSILDFVFSRMTEEILMLDDMAAEETIQLQRLIHMVLENLSSLFESLISINKREEAQKDATHIQLDALVPSLLKFRKLAELLDMPLKSITTSWESGELINCGYTASEVEDFIKAIFTDSPLRKECLWRIENTNLY